MPAPTNNRLGSSYISEALGTTVWPLLSKNASQRRLISAVSIATVPNALSWPTARRPTPRVFRLFGLQRPETASEPDRDEGRLESLANSRRRRVLDQGAGLLGGHLAPVRHGPGVDAEGVSQLGLPVGHALAYCPGHLAQTLTQV